MNHNSQSFLATATGAAALLCMAGIAPAQTWTPFLTTRLQVVAAAADGTAVGIDLNNKLVRLRLGAMKNGNPTPIAWDPMPSLPKSPTAGTAGLLPTNKSYVQLAVGGAGQVWALDKTNGTVYHWTGTAWQLAQGSNPGKIEFISASSDGLAMVRVGGVAFQAALCSANGQTVAEDWTQLTSVPGDVFNVGTETWASNPTNAYLFHPEYGDWQSFPAGFTTMAVPRVATVVGAKADLTVWLGKRNLAAKSSTDPLLIMTKLPVAPPPGRIAAIVDETRIWALSPQGDVFRTY